MSSFPSADPGWAPNPSSKILTVAVDKYKETFGRAPHVGAIHAGLECGILGDKVPGIDCVSFGPTITGKKRSLGGPGLVH